MESIQKEDMHRRKIAVNKNEDGFVSKAM